MRDGAAGALPESKKNAIEAINKPLPSSAAIGRQARAAQSEWKNRSGTAKKEIADSTNRLAIIIEMLEIDRSGGRGFDRLKAEID